MNQEYKTGIQIYNTEFFYGGIGIMWMGLMLCLAFEKINEFGITALITGICGLVLAVFGIYLSLWANEEAFK